ncbi:MAG: DUF1223 domain-containing protein [Pseudomonadota bacterium]
MDHLKALLASAAMTLTGSTLAAAPGPVVVELFTSQGCSSCPPADALLGELSRRPDVLALALHVTYWNDLGWRDQFSQDVFDRRQRWYVEQLKLPSSYTPQMVVNGSHDVVGSQRDAVKRVLDRATRPAAIGVSAQEKAVVLNLPALAHPCDCIVTLFGLQPNVKTPVGRGENKGRTLEEFQVVRAMQSLGRWKGDGREMQAKPAHADKGVSAYAVVAQERISGKVVAAGSH